MVEAPCQVIVELKVAGLTECAVPNDELVVAEVKAATFSFAFGYAPVG